LRAKTASKPLARKTQFLEENQRDFICPVVPEKIFRFRRRANHLYKFAPSRPDKRGGSRSSRTWVGMRWTRMALQDERHMKRTAKSCGPDAPTLASSSRKTLPWATVANKPGHRGEHDISVKTIAWGMPGDSGVTVVTTLVCSFHFACEAAGASRARHSLRPLFSESGMLLAKLGRITPRDREAVCLPSLREAKRRSNPYLLCRAMDCFASLAMTRLAV